MILEIRSWYIPLITVFGRKKNSIYIWYGFVWKDQYKTGGGGGWNLIK